MKYLDLKTVLTVYDNLSFTKAAKLLFISQPAISQIISNLEKELNTLLFVRDKGKITPTPACELFVSKARKIEMLWNDLEQEMKSYHQNTAHTLHIGTTSFFFRFLSYKTEALILQQHLDMKYSIIEDSAGNIERMTYEGKLDFCFTRAPLHQTSLEYEHLFTEEILFVLPADHPLCSQYPEYENGTFPTISLSDFHNSSFVLVNNPRITPMCLRMCEEAGYEPFIALQPTTWEHVRMGILSGRGVGFLSNLHIKENDNENLRFFHIESKYAEMEHLVAYRSAYDITPTARTFIDSFRAHVKKNLENLI